MSCDLLFWDQLVSYLGLELDIPISKLVMQLDCSLVGFSLEVGLPD